MTTQLIDPYATLGIGQGATTNQIRAAYRRLAKRYHPDLKADARATDQMRRINQAWEILSNPARRAEYDGGRAPQHRSGGYSHWAGVTRGAGASTQASTSRAWAAGADRRAYTRAPGYGRGPAYSGAYTNAESDRRPGGLGWGSLLLLVPVAILSITLLSAGILPFPLLGLLVFGVVSQLIGRDR